MPAAIRLPAFSRSFFLFVSGGGNPAQCGGLPLPIAFFASIVLIFFVCSGCACVGGVAPHPNPSLPASGTPCGATHLPLGCICLVIPSRTFSGERSMGAEVGRQLRLLLFAIPPPLRRTISISLSRNLA